MMWRNQVVVCVAALGACVGGVFAQSADDLLVEAARVMRDMSGFEAGLTVRGEGPEMFAATLPSGSSKVQIKLVEKKAPDTDEEVTWREWKLRMSGRGTTGNQQDKDPIEFDLVRRTDADVWVDHRAKRVYEMAANRAIGARSQAYLAARLQIPVELLQTEPFAEERAATELTLAAEAVEVDGVKCHVIEVTYPKPEGAALRTGRLNQKAKFYLGQEDHVVRRIDRISGAGSVSMTIVLEFSGINTKAELTDKTFEIETPEGYEVTIGEGAVNVPSNLIRTQRADAGGDVREAQKEQVRPSLPSAPAFAVVDRNGQGITNESLRGSVAVLYFWGSWCMECRETNPLMSDVASEYGEQGVRVIGIASRERDVAAPGALVSARNYAFEVVPDGKVAVEAFGISVFPTVVVVNAEGGVVGREQFGRGVSSTEVASRVRGLLEKAVPAEAADQEGEDASS